MLSEVIILCWVLKVQIFNNISSFIAVCDVAECSTFVRWPFSLCTCLFTSTVRWAMMALWWPSSVSKAMCAISFSDFPRNIWHAAANICLFCPWIFICQRVKVQFSHITIDEFFFTETFLKAADKVFYKRQNSTVIWGKKLLNDKKRFLKPYEMLFTAY